MGYKQNNNPFNRKISSPLRHNVRNAQGQPWKHTHTDRGFTGTYDTGRVIKGQSTFGQKPDKKFRGGRSEKEISMEYANQLANYYNQGAITGGNFRADDYDKIKNFKRSDRSRGFLSKLTGVDIFRDQHGRVVVDRGRKSKGTGSTNQYNVQQGEWDGKTGAYKNIPTEQVTPEQIYDMMVQGGGMVSIVDGKIVAGNPNESTHMFTKNFDQRSDLPKGFTEEKVPRKKIVEYLDKKGNVTNFNNYESLRMVDNPNYGEEMKAYNAFYDEKSDSPLNQGHETDERSNQTFNLQEGYDYQDPVVTVTEGEWVNDPNNPGQQMRVITTDESITGRRENLNPGGLGQGQAENWGELKEEICSGKRKGDMSICDDVQNISNSVTEYRPIENGSTTGEITTEIVEENLIPSPSLDLGVPGSIKSTGGDFRFHIPDFDLMGGIRAVIDGVVFTNKGKCKAGCATNKNS